jgi:hypothetical protein
MAAREDRLLANQETFRSANEGLIEAASVSPETLVPFLCECADFECLGRLEANLREFDEAHAGDDRYFILPGHLRVEGEEVVSENGRYEVVTKANLSRGSAGRSVNRES